MTRDFDALGAERFDLLVIGGGIYGAWTAYDAALRGLRVALVEARDWGAGTSSASSKLIHGGLRYLEHGQLRLVQRSLAERERLVGLAPHRVRPLRFALPVRRGARVGRLRLHAGLWLYDRLARGSHSVGPHEALSSHEMLERYPFLEAHGLGGGFTYGDCATDDARLVLEIVAGALEAGTVAVNHACVAELLVAADRVVGARVEDTETGAAVEVRAALTLNCAGPWIDGLGQATGARATPLVRLSKGVHLVLPALPTTDALLLPSDDGRVVFLIPWYQRTLLGTTDTDYSGPAGAEQVEAADVEFLLGQARRYLEWPAWDADDVVATFVGLRALPRGAQRQSWRVTREWSLCEPCAGLLTSVGGKLSSARADAARAVDRAVGQLGRAGLRCATAERPLPWRPVEEWSAWRTRTVARGVALGLSEAVADACAQRYGARATSLFDTLERDRALAAPIAPDQPFCRGEIAFAATHEMARSLLDVLRRRVPVLLLGRIDETALRDAADLSGDALGWSAERRRAEAAAVGGACAQSAAGVGRG